MTCPWPHPPHTLTESGDASVKKCYSEALLGSWGGSYRSVEADPKGKCGSGGCPSWKCQESCTVIGTVMS